jgi:hypothetical protein
MSLRQLQSFMHRARVRDALYGIFSGGQAPVASGSVSLIGKIGLEMKVSSSAVVADRLGSMITVS